MAYRRRSAIGSIRMAATALFGALGLVASLALTAPATQAVTPPIPAGLLTTTQIAVGDGATCGITTQQTIVCWGTSPEGLASDTSGIDYVRRALPVAGTVLDGKAIAVLKAGGGHFCALSVDGTFACWGWNDDGQLGDGTLTGRSRPVAIDVVGTPLDGKVIKDFSAGQRSTCAVSTDNVLACWGRFESNVFGTNATLVDVSGTVLEGKAIAGLDADITQACAWTTDGVGACWGGGYLGNGTNTASAKPVELMTSGTALAGQAIVQVDLQQIGGCAVGGNGAVACWGANIYRQLAGPQGVESLAPIDKDMTGSALAGKQVVRLDGHYKFTCAVASEGVLACWGAGDLGDGGTVGSASPVAVTTVGTALEGRSIVEVGTNYGHSCARAGDGATACWGPIGAFQGTGTGVKALVPNGVVGAISVAEAPSVTSVTGTNATSATVSWAPAAEDGGLPRTGYTIAVSPGGPTLTVGADDGTATITGLTPGSPYSIAVTANNVLGASEPSTAKILGSSLTLAAGAKCVTYGTATTLSGTLTDSSGEPQPGRTVSLRRAVWPSTSATAFATVTTNASGRFSLSVKPTVRTTYSASFSGAMWHTGRTSTASAVAVGPRISMRVSDTTVRPGQPVVFTGSVAPDARYGTVRLQRYVSGAWATAKTATVYSSSTYRLTWTPSTTTNYTFRVVLDARGGYAGGVSETRRVVVS